jgi:hypothetical protein
MVRPDREHDVRPSERIFLMPDYSADPIWAESDGAMLPMGELGLSDGALLSLHMWADWFERTEPRPGPTPSDRCYFTTEWDGLTRKRPLP